MKIERSIGIQCHECGKKDKQLFMLTPNNPMFNAHLVICLDCIATLHSFTSPLSILVQVGANTKRINHEDISG